MMKKALLLLSWLGSLPVLAQIPTPQFKVQVVDNQIAIGYGLAIGDVDGDKKLDILLADQKDIVWYRNDGSSGPWKRHVMATNLTPKDNVCIAARDIDGDGRVEVAVGAMWNPAETKDLTQRPCSTLGACATASRNYNASDALGAGKQKQISIDCGAFTWIRKCER